MSGALHVEAHGTGAPLVLLHGWAMHSGVWGPLVTELAACFRVHAVDLPGHGGSAAIVPYTLETATAAVAAHFRQSQSLVVLGWSLGGLIALHWAQLHPQRVVKLVLVSTSPRFVAAEDWPHAMTRSLLIRFGDELNASYRLTILRFLSLQLQGTTDGRSALGILRRRFFERGAPSLPALCEALALLATTDLRASVPRVRQPSLVVAGDRDMLVPLAAAQWLSDSLPDARLAVIAGAAHAPFLSHPARFAAALRAFLDE